MKVDLTKEDLINLVCSITPTYEKIEELVKLGVGVTWGGGLSSERWEWNRAFLNKLPEENLFKLYKLVKVEIIDALAGLVITSDIQH